MRGRSELQTLNLGVLGPGAPRARRISERRTWSLLVGQKRSSFRDNRPSNKFAFRTLWTTNVAQCSTRSGPAPPEGPPQGSPLLLRGARDDEMKESVLCSLRWLDSVRANVASSAVVVGWECCSSPVVPWSGLGPVVRFQTVENDAVISKECLIPAASSNTVDCPPFDFRNPAVDGQTPSRG